jgi:hypothetical protein
MTTMIMIIQAMAIKTSSIKGTITVTTGMEILMMK